MTLNTLKVTGFFILNGRTFFREEIKLFYHDQIEEKIQEHGSPNLKTCLFGRQFSNNWKVAEVWSL